MTGQLRTTYQLAGWGALFVGLYWTSLRSYPLFHSLAEGFSIAVAAGIFLVAWNARGFLPNGYLLFLGIASLFVAFLDLLHTLAYKGMGVFPGHGADLPTQLWIAARYMGSISFLLAPAFLAKRLRPHLLLAAYALATSVLLLSIFTWGIFPTCYIEGVGLTPFKRASEYLISLGLGAAILLLLRNRQAFDARVLRLIVGSIGISILSEFTFTLYLGVYDLANLLGHYLKIVSCYLLYVAIIDTGLRKPYDLLFRDLKQSEQVLQRVRDDLDARVRERTAELAKANEHLRTEIAERQRSEETLVARTLQLEAVRVVTAEIARELDLSKVLRLITQHAEQLIGGCTATVWLWDEAGQVLVAQVWPGRKEWMGRRRLRLGEGLVGIVAERREGQLVNEYSRWPQALPFVVERGTISSAVAEPLLYHDRLLGVLVADDEGTGRTFTQKDGDLLRLFAQHAAIAIQNALLFEQVQEGSARLGRLSRRLVEVQEGERRHIARELHDEIGQSLTGLKLLLEMSGRGSLDKWRENQADAEALVADLLNQVRELSLRLRPGMLDDLGLLPTLTWHFQRYEARTGVRVLLKETGMAGRRFPSDVEIAAYRTVQEALTNVARHAKVSEVTVCVWAGTESLSVQISDQGIGFDSQAALAARASSGLVGMQERVELLGGHVTVESAPGSGACVTAEFPIEAGASGA